jgi:predicted nucleic acid-binding protein
MAVVVSDTSPIRAFAHLDSLAWLEALFSHVLLPPAVAYELKHAPAAFVAIDASDIEFVKIRAPADADRVPPSGVREGQVVIFDGVA